jgi:hypothetical protein
MKRVGLEFGNLGAERPLPGIRKLLRRPDANVSKIAVGISSKGTRTTHAELLEGNFSLGKC